MYGFVAFVGFTPPARLLLDPAQPCPILLLRRCGFSPECQAGHVLLQGQKRLQEQLSQLQARHILSWFLELSFGSFFGGNDQQRSAFRSSSGVEGGINETTSFYVILP